MDEAPRLRRTLLGGKPRAGAAWVALVSVWVCAMFTVEYWEDYVGLQQYLAGSGTAVFSQGEWWRLLSTTLIHADVLHLGVNMVALAILSWLVYGYFGTLIYPVASFFLGGLVNLVSLLTYPPNVTLVGASGVVYLLAGLWLTSYFLIERQHTVRHRALRLFGFSILMLLPASIEPTVSYRAHAIGAAIGVVFGIVHFYLRKDEIREAEIWDEPAWGITKPSDEDESGDPPAPSPRTIH